MKILYVILFSSMLLPSLVFAADPMASLFNFQSKMVQQGSVEAMMKLGNMYEEGQGTQQDWDKALDMYRQAERNGNANAKAAIQRIEQKKKQRLEDIKLYKEHAAKEERVREEEARIQAEKIRIEKEISVRQLQTQQERLRVEQINKQHKEAQKIKKQKQQQELMRKQPVQEEIPGYDEDS